MRIINQEQLDIFNIYYGNSLDTYNETRTTIITLTAMRTRLD